MSDTEKGKLLKKYNITADSLPKIAKDDSAIQNLNVKEGDLIRIDRKSQTAGQTHYYRVVTEG